MPTWTNSPLIAVICGIPAILVILGLCFSLGWLVDLFKPGPKKEKPYQGELIVAVADDEIDAQLREADSRRHGRKRGDRPRFVVIRSNPDYYNRGAAGTNIRFVKKEGEE